LKNSWSGSPFQEMAQPETFPCDATLARIKYEFELPKIVVLRKVAQNLSCDKINQAKSRST
jgi:hypothetical protein